MILSHTDMRTQGVIAALPERLRPYALLMRLDRPIGTWLLLLPCWWGVCLAAKKFPNLWLMLLFAAGAVVMRGAGCVVNDIYDRHLDRQVERTRDRPLASGQVSVMRAVIFLGVLLLAGLGVLCCFNQATVMLGVASLVLVFTYPLMKRLTWWPQLFLGLTFNGGALLGGCAVTGGVDFTHFVLYIAGIFWTLGYDTIYAHQDARDDAALGIKSTALLFGARSRRWVFGFYLAVVVLLLFDGWIGDLSAVYFYGVAVAACYALAQFLLWRPDDAANCLRRFKSNCDFGLIILAAIILGKAI